MRGIIVAVALLLSLGGCVTDRKTDTPRSATEELLISSAADRAAEALGKRIPAHGRLFIDASNFDATDAKDAKYAIGVIRDALLRRNVSLVDKKTDADVVVELRSGALATNDHEFLIGIPSFNVPLPFAGPISTPKIAIYDRATQLGVAKFAASGLGAKTGSYVFSSQPQYGFAHKTGYIVLVFFGWNRDDLIPKEQRDPDFD
jgi:hypothetical protein